MEALEEYDRQDACNVVLFPPDEGEVSDVDSDGEDWGVKDPNHLGKKILNHAAELEVDVTDDTDDPNVLNDTQVDHTGTNHFVEDDAVLDAGSTSETTGG